MEPKQKGVDFSVEDKNKIAKTLANDWCRFILRVVGPGANPVDNEFF